MRGEVLFVCKLLAVGRHKIEGFLESGLPTEDCFTKSTIRGLHSCGPLIMYEPPQSWAVATSKRQMTSVSKYSIWLQILHT